MKHGHGMHGGGKMAKMGKGAKPGMVKTPMTSPTPKVGKAK